MAHQPVSELNNTAIAFMQQGYYEHAIENLTIAVMLLLHSDKTPFAAGFRRDAVLARKQLHRVKIVASATTTHETQITLGSMYSRAFLLVNSPANDINYNLLVGVVLYNLALLNHLCGINQSKKCGLAKALKLYESVLSVIQQQPTGIDMYHLTLAVTQNMGQIHSYLFHRNEAMACFECLRQLLSNDNQLIPEDDFAMFFVSAMFQANELHLAPAA
jgi:tetratricopeptide (TPR) repeat protein